MKPSIKLLREFQNDHELFGEASDGEFLSRETAYNEEGKIVSFTSYIKEGVAEQRVTNEYDSKGRLISETVEYPQDGLLEKHAFEYDEKDRIIKQKKIYDDGTFELTELIFDDSTHTTFSKHLDADGVLESKQETVHDAAGNVILLTIRNEKGEELHREEYAYNEKNKPLQYAVVDSENGVAAGAVYFYNEAGFLREVKKLNEKGNQVSSEHYTADEQGNILSMEEENNLHGTSHLAFESQYDENNRVTMTVYYTEAGIPKRRDTYVYGESGNILEQSHFLMNVARGSNEHYTRRFDYEFYDTVISDKS